MKKGFTLIELLVVIAIIGILASIVMVSMSGATNQAKDARIQGDLTQVRSIAELIRNNNSSYALVCSSTNIGFDFTDTNYGTQLKVLGTDIDGQQGVVNGASTKCFDSATLYCVSAQLVADSTKWYCLDSDGRAWSTSSTACEGTNYDCL